MDLTFEFARRGLGKTWFSLALACSFASKTAYIGPWQVQAILPVLYVDGEMPFETIQQRTADLGASEALAVLNHKTLFHKSGAVLNLRDLVCQTAVAQHCLISAIKVLVFDNLSCLVSGVKGNDAGA